jgi:hypothetical protein
MGKFASDTAGAPSVEPEFLQQSIRSLVQDIFGPFDV